MWNRSGVLLGVLVAAMAACGGKGGDGKTTPTEGASSVPKVDPTLCETGGKNVVTADLNKDNKPDVWRLYKNEDEGGTRVEYMTCQQIDFDHDGRKDWAVGYGRKGGKQFEKADLDYDGKFDLSQVYDPKTGLIAEVERDTNFDGKYDLREIYDSSGVISSVRIDSDGNQVPDVWEQYKDGQLIAILYDEDGDNKVDRREEVPGSRPKFDMPEPERPEASSAIPKDGAAPAPAPAPAPKGGSDGGAAKPKLR